MDLQNSNYLAVKFNTLIRQRTNLSLSQMKIVLFLIQAIDFDDNKKRIALGLKQLSTHPWDAMEAELKIGDNLVIKKAAKPICLIHPENYDYFDNLKSKLLWGKDKRHE